MQIIISADDFGRSHNRNMAVDYAMKKGFIKSAALMCSTDYSKEAVDLAIEGGYIENIHCHFNLTSGMQLSGNSKPVSENYIANSLLCRNGDFVPLRELRSYSIPIRFTRIIYDELDAQYNRFIDMTKGQGNYSHVDFHLYDNLRFPVAIAYNKIIKQYGIKSARWYGVHHVYYPSSRKTRYIALLKKIIHTNCIRVPSGNIDFFLTDRMSFGQETCELYVHPDYSDGNLIDNSMSFFNHPIQMLEKHIERLSDPSHMFVSWKEYDETSESK